MNLAQITQTACAVILFFLTSLATGQDSNAALQPPKGDREAIVVFEDLQCPQCRNTAPVVKQAAKTYKIPLVRHDFPLPMHNWSFDAAVIAHYFDAHSKSLGYEYRDYIFEHQPEINPQNLRAFSDKFAAEHKVEVNTEKNVGVSVGINHTPTIYIVSSKPGGKPYIEVTDRNQLFQLIDAMK
jgi:protein-disulfide isomerase